MLWLRGQLNEPGLGAVTEEEFVLTRMVRVRAHELALVAEGEAARAPPREDDAHAPAFAVAADALEEVLIEEFEGVARDLPEVLWKVPRNVVEWLELKWR